MTGLNVDRDQIIEVASLITDGELNVVAEVCRYFLKTMCMFYVHRLILLFLI